MNALARVTRQGYGEPQQGGCSPRVYTKFSQGRTRLLWDLDASSSGEGLFHWCMKSSNNLAYSLRESSTFWSITTLAGSNGPWLRDTTDVSTGMEWASSM